MKPTIPLLLSTTLGLVVLTGCQDAPTAEERLDAYIKLWEKQDYDKMYAEYASEQTKSTYGKKEFIERTKKLAASLDIEELSVKRLKSTENEDSKKASLPVEISFETLAGAVSYDKQVPLTFEKQRDSENWYIDWDSSFVLKGFKKDDRVQLTTLEAKRGDLLDSEKRPLATTDTGAQVGAIAGQLKDVSTLAKLLDRTVSSIEDALDASWVKDGQFVPLKTYAADAKSQLTRLEQVDGVSIKETEVRTYPFGKATSHLIGYTGSATADEIKQSKQTIQAGEQVGKRGLEQVLDETLRGTAGARIEIIKPDDTTIDVAETEAKDGQDIQLTIDGTLQQQTYKTMKDDPGTAAAIDPRTGETRVLLSSPGFDPAEFTTGISQARLDALTKNPDQPLLNRFTSAFAPGSTQKPLTAAVGLKSKTLDPEKDYTIDGLKTKIDGFNVTRIHETPDPVNLHNALVYSDNIYFAKSTLEQIGTEAFTSGLEALGYGEKIPFTYPMRASQISNDGSIASDGQLMDTSYGQGQMLTNILHLASMYEIFLTDGIIYRPTLLTEETTKQVWKKDVLDAKDAAMIRDDLYDVVHAGYPLPADIPEVKVAGKTGTAELKKAGEENGQENGFFVGYDDDKKDLLVAIMIESVEQEDRGSPYVSGLVADVLKSHAEK
ncbi:penicillin-binding transpeptidase domain-containing protein [Exiguobacterium antarcticum]|uniref:Penicillin-binding transpeptidase domain-containing protein n=1 Tax=Exiguobacterium antarcticum TaxID=132920 RepID=A0ABT6R324_9BACL|nr:penicillin-binding transpeptidase domain-containing protein [Exiguobacterium antarcticum]MDI3235336.1 penicillin-binding transpeptidase domain-containing protein [Exiguobacterium antarcticum]